MERRNGLVRVVKFTSYVPLTNQPKFTATIEPWVKGVALTEGTTQPEVSLRYDAGDEWVDAALASGELVRE